MNFAYSVIIIIIKDYKLNTDMRAPPSWQTLCTVHKCKFYLLKL